MLKIYLMIKPHSYDFIHIELTSALVSVFYGQITNDVHSKISALHLLYYFNGIMNALLFHM